MEQLKDGWEILQKGGLDAGGGMGTWKERWEPWLRGAVGTLAEIVVFKVWVKRFLYQHLQSSHIFREHLSGEHFWHPSKGYT